jgi:hypothetical protein
MLGIGDSSLRGYTNKVVSIDNQMPIGSSYMNDLWRRFLARCRKGNGKDKGASDHTEMNDVEQLEEPEEPYVPQTKKGKKKKKEKKDLNEPDTRFLARRRNGNGKDTRGRTRDGNGKDTRAKRRDGNEKDTLGKRRDGDGKDTRAKRRDGKGKGEP